MGSGCGSVEKIPHEGSLFLRIERWHEGFLKTENQLFPIQNQAFPLAAQKWEGGSQLEFEGVRFMASKY